MSDLVRGPDGALRCAWHATDPLYGDYHDREWGRPVTSDAGLFERLSLEGFQAGLSWLTILRKRDAFRRAFSGFDPAEVARFDTDDVERLLHDAGIVRNRAKIEATVSNARRALEMIEVEGALAPYFRRFRLPDQPAPRFLADLPSSTGDSAALSRDLKGRGWRFVGPTTMYALMQAVGLVNDHLAGCFARAACEAEGVEAWGS